MLRFVMFVLMILVGSVWGYWCGAVLGAWGMVPAMIGGFLVGYSFMAFIQHLEN